MRLPAALLIVVTALAPTLAPAASAEPAAGYALTVEQGSRLLVDAKVNGRPVTALLDSAAEATFLDRQFARDLNLIRGPTVAGQGSGKAAFDATLANDVTLQALGLTLPHQTVAVADLADVGQRLLGHRVEVILGREIFDAARLVINIEERRIAVVARDKAPRGMRLELVTEHGVETIPVKVENAEPVRATFDLGNGSYVLVGSAFAAKMKFLTDGRPVSRERGGGLGGEAQRGRFALHSVEIAGRVFTDVEAAIDDQPSASDVNIGVVLLRHFLITTDYSQHAVWLAPRD